MAEDDGVELADGAWVWNRAEDDAVKLADDVHWVWNQRAHT